MLKGFTETAVSTFLVAALNNYVYWQTGYLMEWQNLIILWAVIDMRVDKLFRKD